MDGESDDHDDRQSRGQRERQPRRNEARQQPHERGAQHEGELIRGALIGQCRVKIGCRPVPGQRHPANTGQRADLRAGEPHGERGSQHQDEGASGERGNRVGGADDERDRQRVEECGENQHRALAEPVGEESEDRRPEGRPDAHCPGGEATDCIGAACGGHQGEGSDSEHREREPSEESDGEKGPSRELRQHSEAAEPALRD